MLNLDMLNFFIVNIQIVGALLRILHLPVASGLHCKSSDWSDAALASAHVIYSAQLLHFPPC
jgi:hypothetical protein